MMKYTILMLLIASTVSSCFLGMGERVRGDGNLTSEDRNISDFKGVVSSGSFDVYLTTGNDYSVKVESDGNILQYIETELSNGNLKISTTDGYNLSPENGMKVYVTAPIYNNIKVSGSGNIFGKNEITGDDELEIDISGSGNVDVGIKAPSVSADISGSGSIMLSGETKSFSSSTAGSGDIKAGNLKTDEAKVRIAGSGNANIHVNQELSVDIAGSGDVKYTGNPKVSSHIAGSGSVSKTD